MTSSWKAVTTLSRSFEALNEQMPNMVAAEDWLHITVEVGFKKLHEPVDLLLHLETCCSGSSATVIKGVGREEGATWLTSTSMKVGRGGLG